MAAPPAALAGPPEPGMGLVVSRRARLHFDFVFENPAPDDTEFHLDIVTTERTLAQGVVDLARRLFRPNNDVAAENLAAIARAMMNVQAQVVGPAPAQARPPNEVRFRPRADGQLVCSACDQPIAPDQVGPHAQTHAPGAQLHDEILMREVRAAAREAAGVAGDGAIPPAPEAPPAGDLVALGAVEDAANGVVRIDGTVGFDELPGNGVFVICRGCRREVHRAAFEQHATGHVRVPP